MGSWLDHVQKHLKYSKYSWFTFSDIYKTPKSDINCFTFYPTTVFPPGLNWTHWSRFVVLILFNELTCQGRAWCCSLWWRRLVIYTTCCTSLYFSFSEFIYQVYECVFACEWAWGLCSSLVLTLIRVQVYLISVQVCFRSLSHCIPSRFSNSSKSILNSSKFTLVLQSRTWPDPWSLTCFCSPLFTIKNMQHSQKSAVTMFLVLSELLQMDDRRWGEVLASAGGRCGSPPANLRLTEQNCWVIWINL